MTPRRLPKVLTDEQARALLALPSRRYPTGRRNRALLAMLYVPCCLRVGESVKLKLRDVDLAERTVRVWRGKGGRDRTVYLDDATTAALREWLDVRPKGAETLFSTLKGGPLSARYVQQLTGRLGAKAGLAVRVTPHVFRHSGASELLRRGFTLADVQRLLGHSNIATANIYLHVFNTDLAAKVWALNGVAAEPAAGTQGGAQ